MKRLPLWTGRSESARVGKLLTFRVPPGPVRSHSLLRRKHCRIPRPKSRSRLLLLTRQNRKSNSPESYSAIEVRLAKSAIENWTEFGGIRAGRRTLSGRTSELESAKLRGNLRFLLRFVFVSLLLSTIWRRERDSNPRYPFRHNGFQDRRYQPLTHPSAGGTRIDCTSKRAVSVPTSLLALLEIDLLARRHCTADKLLKSRGIHPLASGTKGVHG